MGTVRQKGRPCFQGQVGDGGDNGGSAVPYHGAAGDLTIEWSQILVGEILLGEDWGKMVPMLGGLSSRFQKRHPKHPFRRVVHLCHTGQDMGGRPVPLLGRPAHP